jgi:hypothetical protein
LFTAANLLALGGALFLLSRDSLTRATPGSG